MNYQCNSCFEFFEEEPDNRICPVCFEAAVYYSDIVQSDLHHEDDNY